MITLPVVLETKYAANNVHRLFPDCILPDVSLFFRLWLKRFNSRILYCPGA